MSTGTESVSEMFTRNIARYQKPTLDQQPELIAKAPVVANETVNLSELPANATVLVLPEAKTLPILIRPTAPTWEQLVEKIDKIVNLPGLWFTITELYDAGYGAELITAAEMAMEIHAKQPKREKPNNLFAKSISKKSGNWETKTLKLVKDAWEARQHALEVVERLDLKKEPKIYLRVLALAWKLKGTIIRYLGMAMEEGRGIKNPAGMFFAQCANALQVAAR